MLKSQIPPNYIERRMRLMKMDSNACFIFFGAGEVARNHDTHFPFSQDSNFHYLTEYDEPNAALVLVGGKSHLFVLDRDETHEIWDGERYGIERAKSTFQMDEVFSERDFFTKLEELLVDANKVFYTLGIDSARDQRVIKTIHQAKRYQGQGRFGHLPIHDPLPLVSELRIVKDELEVGFLKKAASTTARAHLQILKRAKAGMTEFAVLNEFQYYLFQNGCTSHGYGPIFAAGYNATTLHYVKNDDLLRYGDLLLVDAGGQVNGYTADLTQTFPVSGTFSLPQKQVYEKVLEVNREITKITKPGTSYRTLHARSVEMITEALLSLGVLEGDRDSNIKAMTYRKYYPHGLGHYLGLDVHDVGIYRERGKDFELKSGMLITNEPGLYFRDRGSQFYGIGIRIEDDLLITDTGVEVLTSELPRDIETIENLRTIANN